MTATPIPEIKIIGSTTLEEYYSYFNKDKALSRRFQNIFIDEPDEEETKEILLGIKKDYEEFHNIKYDTNTIKQIIKYANIYFPNKTFPDKAIDLLDELGSRNKKPYKTTLKQIIKDYSGIYTIEENRFYSIKLCYPELKKYYLPLILLKDNNKNNICVIKATKSFQLDKFKLDLKKIFNIKVENILTIDLKYYNDITSLNNLIGSSKGYVGYNEGGLLTEHILKYPISVIYMKNFGKSNYTVESFFKNLFTSKHIVDSKNRTIYLRNVIFIYEDFDSNKVIGFKNQSIKKEYIYDIEI